MIGNSENANPIMSISSTDSQKDNFIETLNQNEKIQFIIDYQDGTTQKGEL